MEARGRASDRAEPKADRNAVVRARGDRNAQYDLLTAALIGAAVGVSATLLLRGATGGTGNRRVLDPALEAARRAGRKGARWARKRGEALRQQGGSLWDRVPRDEISDAVRGYAESAREAVDRAVDREIRDLRKQLRRQRRRIHL